MSASGEHLPGWATRMLVEARVGHLGMLDGRDRPRVLPVTFVFHGGLLWTAVDDKPKHASGDDLARVRFLRRRPQAALTVDRYSDQWDALAWVQALGPADVLEMDDEREAAAALAAKYEPYREHPPPGPLIRLTPGRFLCWRASE